MSKTYKFYKHRKICSEKATNFQKKATKNFSSGDTKKQQNFLLLKSKKACCSEKATNFEKKAAKKFSSGCSEKATNFQKKATKKISSGDTKKQQKFLYKKCNLIKNK